MLRSREDTGHSQSQLQCEILAEWRASICTRNSRDNCIIDCALRNPTHNPSSRNAADPPKCQKQCPLAIFRSFPSINVPKNVPESILLSLTLLKRPCVNVTCTATIPRDANLPLLAEFVDEPVDLLSIKSGDAAHFRVGQAGPSVLGALLQDAENPRLGCLPVDTSCLGILPLLKRLP